MKIFSQSQSIGIHPKNYKWMAQNQLIEKLSWPDQVVIPITQHQGPRPKIIVKVGKQVQAGDIIAKAVHPRSVNVHASINGEIIAIKPWSGSQDKDDLAIEIKKTTTVHQEKKSWSLDEWLSRPNEDIISKIAEAGIVGLGGAVFPTHLKLSIPSEKSIDTLIINGAECEPYINADYRLMIEQPQALIHGIQLVNKIVQAKNIVVAVEDHHAHATKSIATTGSSQLDLKFKILPVSYPQGDESILIKTITSRAVPIGGLPWDVGAVVLNISTIIAVKQALLDSQPLINRVVTVSGAGVKQSKNLLVPIGTSLNDLFQACGGLLSDTKKIITGGPMMGRSQSDLATPVTKSTNGVLALLEQEIVADKIDNPCIRCGRCIEACPYGLQPELLFKAVRQDNLKKAQENYLFSCRECGCCDYVCPARIPLAEVFRSGKNKIRNNKHE